MAKESGLGMTLSIDDSAGVLKDVSNDVSAVNFSTPQGLQDVTGLDKSAMERLILLSDGNVQITVPAFNDAADHIWAVLKTRTGTRTVTIAHSGQTLSMEMLIADVAWSRNADGSLGASAQFQLQSGTVPVWS
jgi:hypothetical protein